MAVSEEAHIDPKHFYDSRYQAGYMHGFDYDVYEAARIRTIREAIAKLKKDGFSPAKILDYGCGEGRYIGELSRHFPNAELVGCDISDIGLSIAARENPAASFVAMTDERIQQPDSSFDFIISIEVIEHVRDVKLAISEIARVLKPGGLALITTPCANRWSAEWLEMKLTGGLEDSADGFGRFRSDEPGHLRRLTSEHLKQLFAACGVRTEAIYYRAHLFTRLSTMKTVKRLLPMRHRVRLAMMDWRLFRRLPNGATLLGLFRKA